MRLTNLEKIQKICAEQLGVNPNEVTPETHFERDLGADSLEVVELIMNIEDDFEIVFEDLAAIEIETVQDVLDYIEGRWHSWNK